MANKKINQLVAKTTIQSTDLFPLGDASTGQLFKKTIAELQAAIGGAVISVNGLVGTVVLDTDDIQELASPTNRYFTDARARGAISLTVSGNSGASTYNSSTGVLNVPTYTLAGLGGITASFLSGASGIAYNSSTGVITYTGTVFTDASIRALVSGGTGITYNSSTGAISYSGTVFTDASVRGLLSLTTTGTSGASTYNSTTGVINVPNYNLAGLGGITLASLSGTAPITYNSSTGAIGITQASGSTNGFLSSTDWTTFNGKQSALTLGNVSEVVSNVLMFPDGQNGKTIGNLSIQVVQAGSTTNGFLSSANWNTFNNKQNTITLTTTGTSGASTFSSNTLNIPQYQAVLTNPVTGTGTTNFVTKWTSSSAIGNSLIFDNGTQVAIGNTTASSFDSAANQLVVGNGTTNQGITIFASTTTESSIYFADGTGVASYRGYIFYNHTSDSLAFGTNAARAMTINSGGDVLISTSTSAANPPGFARVLNIRNTDAALVLSNTSGTAKDWSIGALTSGSLAIFDGSSERMRITSGGNILLGTTTDNGERLYVSGSIRATGSITANSDARLKKNIERIENALEKVGQISGYTYNTIYDEDRHAGVIAQEIDKVLPEIVNKGNDGLLGVEYGNISALLIEAIKDLKKDNESLRAIVEGLSK